MIFKDLAIMISKFSTVGVIVTIFSLLLSTFLIEVLDFSAVDSYIISYLITLFMSYLINSIFVFNSAINLKNNVIYFMIYGFSMLTGLYLVFLMENHTKIDSWLLPYIVLPFTMSINFLGSYFFLKRNENA